MKTLYLSISVMIITFVIPVVLGVGWGWMVLPCIAFGVTTFVLVNRYFGKKIEGILTVANQDLQLAQEMVQRAQSQANAQAMKRAQQQMTQASTKAVEVLKGALEYSDWQAGSHASINAQIGMVIFSNEIFQAMQKKPNKLADAIPYLDASLVTGTRANFMQGLWHAWLRLAVCEHRVNQNFDRIKEVMEAIVAVAKKEGFAWATYAWFCAHYKHRDQAVEVLARGAQESVDPKLKTILQAAQNDKPIKLGEYGNQWWGLGLELSKQMKNAQKGGGMGHPRMRSSRRGRR